ncbi:dihydroxyacetone kinase family protein [Streptomyces sp. NPDC059063]|uniref:dihydroxyacetone kinase family protein n=1 Tax=unclassified Streptomyces TaxID=2593676 RepID=UPI00367E87D9
MSYFLPETAPVLTAARGLALAHPGIVEVNSAPLYLRARAAHPDRRVGLVSGGGSGHEPLHTGLLGRGGLDAVCPGEVFASPHNRQIYEASAAAAKSAGVLLIVKNYTGDVINFQIAAERLRHDGIPVATVLVDDDLATDGADSATGRRGTAATVVVEKLLGAAADRGASLEELQELGTRVVAQSRSVAVAARAQTSPTTAAPAFTLEPGVLDYGVGIHGERGTRTIARPSVDDLVRRMTDDLLDALPAGSEDVLALVNGLGATTELELHAISALLHDRLLERGLRPAVTVAGTYTAALDMAGFSLTLTRLDEGWVDLWTAPTETPLMLPRTVRAADAEAAAPASASTAPATPTASTAAAPAETARTTGSRIVLDRYAEVVAQVRDNLTKLDQLVGDGDFGDNLTGGVRRAVRIADETGSEGTAALADAFLNDVGGTSGPLFGLLFKDLASAEPGDGQAPSVAALAEAAAAASAAIHRVGGARVGDCTLVDALVPAAESLAASAKGEPTGEGDAESAEAPLTTAAQAAIRGALSTASLRPRRGRASYVGDHALGVPDPGALAVALLFTSLADVHEPTWATRLPAPGYLTAI